MKFWKVQAVLNDFVLVHSASHQSVDWSRAAIQICDRHFGIGSDGLLVLDRKNLRMFNPDGTEDFCGNGLRCAAVHAFHQGWIERADVMVHHGLPVHVWVTGDWSSRVELGLPSFAPADVPLSLQDEVWQRDLEIGGETVRVSSLSTGSTHTVILEDRLPTDERFFRVSAPLEHHAWFPDRTSTMWAAPVDDWTLQMRPFERGLGETQGCGTGSAAVATVWARMTGRTGTFDIINPGGTVRVHLERLGGPVHIESETEAPFEGELEPDWVQRYLLSEPAAR